MFERITIPELISLGLSRRESEVLACVMRGKTNAEIGTVLQISPRTVKKHLEHVFRKLGAKTRMTAVIAAMENLQHHKVGARPRTS